MDAKRREPEELETLAAAYRGETDAVRRLELRLELVREKCLEIREAWDKYNDNSQRIAMDELEAFFKSDEATLPFHTEISRERYSGDWSS